MVDEGLVGLEQIRSIRHASAFTTDWRCYQVLPNIHILLPEERGARMEFMLDGVSVDNLQPDGLCEGSAVELPLLDEFAFKELTRGRSHPPSVTVTAATHSQICRHYQSSCS